MLSLLLDFGRYPLSPNTCYLSFLPSIISIMVTIICFICPMQTNKISKNNIIGYCEIDLFEFLARVSGLLTILYLDKLLLTWVILLVFLFVCFHYLICSFFLLSIKETTKFYI